MPLTTTNRQAQINIIRNLPEDIQAILKGLTDEQLDTSCGEGEWTIRQVVHHLADSHMNSFIRLKLILTENHPTIQPYDQEAWANLPDSLELPLEATFLLLTGLHQRWTALFDSLSAEAWQRTGYHPEIGDITPDDLVQIYAQHCQEHIEQVKRAIP